MVAAVVAIVMVVVAAVLPDGVTVTGEKLHVDSLGKPEQAKDTLWLNPFCGVTVMVNVPLCPFVTVSAEALVPRVKSPGLVAVLTVSETADDVLPLKLVSPP